MVCQSRLQTEKQFCPKHHVIYLSQTTEHIRWTDDSFIISDRIGSYGIFHLNCIKVRKNERYFNSAIALSFWYLL